MEKKLISNNDPKNDYMGSIKELAKQIAVEQRFHFKQENKRLRATILATSIPVITGLFTLAVSLHAKHADHLIEQRNWQMSAIENRIERKGMQSIALNGAMINIRNLLVIGSFSCVGKKFIGSESELKDFQKKWITSDFNLTKVNYATLRNLDANIYQQVKTFGDLAFRYDNPCLNTKDLDSKLRDIQNNINLLVEATVEQDRKELKKLRSTIF